MKSKKIILCVTLLCIALVALFALCAFSEDIALARAGVDTGKTIRPIIELGIMDDVPYKVLQASTKNGDPIILRLTKNKLGFWQTDRLEETREGQTYAEHAWMIDAGLRRFSVQDVTEFNDEWHYVCTGNDAQKRIEIPNELVPENTTINIQQSGGFYLIHVVSFGDPQYFQQLNIPTYLKENGFIPSTT